MKECGVVLCFLLWILAIFLVPVIEGKACNTSGWFGDNCQYQCHCVNVSKCDLTTGECRDNTACEKGWFGPACQYVDLTTTETTGTDWLYDGDDTTCNPNSGKEYVTVDLNQPFIFTWLRLHVSDPEDLDSITVLFTTNTSNNLMSCNNKKTAAVNDNTLDIHCDLDVLVQHYVVLAGQGVASLCSVYISGGRNVALKQPTTQSSSYRDWKKTFPLKAVDGNRDGNWHSGSCTQTKDGDANPSWRMTFGNPQTINRYVLYNRQDDEPERLLYFNLTSYTEDGRQVFTYQDQKTEPQDVYTVIPDVTSTSPVSSVTIRATYVSASANDTTPVLTLCEVETYGDTVCPQGRYGRECEHSCDNCRNQICFVSTGRCPDRCLDGFTGDKSETHCPLSTYGQDCSQRCSANCVDQHCNPVTGVCNRCPPGKTGDFCDQASTQQESPVSGFGVGVGVGVGVCVLVAVVIVGVYCCRKRVHNAMSRRQRSPTYDGIDFTRQEEHNYMALGRGNHDSTQARDKAPDEVTTSNTQRHTAAKENTVVDEYYEDIAGDTCTGQPDEDYVNNVTKTSGVKETDDVYVNCPDETKF